MTLLQEMQLYIGFGSADAEALAALLPHARPHFEAFTEAFYAAVLSHPNAHRAITGGPTQVTRLRRTLEAWMEEGLQGPHDEAWFARRARIGRMHVRISLPQQYMFTAMNLIRRGLQHVVAEAFEGEARLRTQDAVDRLLDLELAIMLHTYREDSETKMRTQERLATIGHVSTSIAHELRNPLGVIESSVYLLRRRLAPLAKPVAKHLDRIEGQVRSSANIITDLLEMARSRSALRVHTSIEPLVRETIEQMQEASRAAQGVPIHHEVPPGLVAKVEPGLLARALANLLDNAVAAVAAGGAIAVRVWKDEHGLHICVEDEGPGFEEAILEQVFEPLVTGRAKGVGLGLALVRRICERHGGEVHAQNRIEGGARVIMSLPSGPEAS